MAKATTTQLPPVAESENQVFPPNDIPVYVVHIPFVQEVLAIFI